MRLILILAATLALGPLASALAGADDKDRRRKNDRTEKARDTKERERRDRRDDKVDAYKFRVRDKDYIRSYWYGRYGHRSCPPGLFRSGRYCYAQGWTKKRYVVGHPLDRALFVEPLPPLLVTRLGPPPAGYRYGIVDGDIVLLALGTLLVVDSIDLLVD